MRGIGDEEEKEGLCCTGRSSRLDESVVPRRSLHNAPLRIALFHSVPPLRGWSRGIVRGYGARTKLPYVGPG